METFEGAVLPHLRSAPHIDTKINALLLMIEVAKAVAYAPEGKVPDFIRNNGPPRFLQHEMFKVVSTFLASETRLLVEEKSFICQLKELRYKPMVIWKGDTWNALDEILRVLKDDGPVDFKRIPQGIKDSIANRGSTSNIGSMVAREVWTEIAGYVSASSCYETKYNALNTVVDIVIHMLSLSFHFSNAATAYKALNESLLNIGNMFDSTEIDKTVAETRREPEQLATGVVENFRTIMLPTLGKGLFGLPLLRYRNSMENTQQLLKNVYARKTSERDSSHGNIELLLKIL